MINCRGQIYEALKEITENVKLTRPEGDSTFPLITYSEVTNVSINARTDRIEYQIDAYSNTFGECLALSQDIDDTMTGMGWHRTYVTPDEQTRRGKDLYKKTMSYAARVDTLWHNIILGGY